MTDPHSTPGRGQALYEQAKHLIPGGTQLLSKRCEMFAPNQWPAYYSRAQGVDIWDLDARRYVDMSYSAIGTSILGYADPDVNAAIHAAIDAGSATTLNCPEDVELATLLCELHPWADMVRYARGGGEAMAVAVRIARARTGRDMVAVCGYHGWHDWYLAANLGSGDALDEHLLAGLQPAGVPRALRGTICTFHYNRLHELEMIAARNGRELAAIVMEPIRSQQPQPSFLEGVRAIADETGAVLVFDEVTAGFRLTTGGAHLLYPVEPDIAVFAKAIGNGYPMAAVIGTETVMQAAQDTFISSTNWTERIGPVAALATIRKHRRLHVAEHLIAIGNLVQEGWLRAAERCGLPLHVSGIAPLGHFTIEHEDAQAARTLFTQIMLSKGFLATNSFYASYAHQEVHVSAYFAAVEEAFAQVWQCLQAGTVREQLHGPVAHSGFERLT